MTAICEVCGEELRFQWSDTHGVGVCLMCGLPYTIFHYEGEGKGERRVDKPPSCAIKPEWLPLARKYWELTRRRVFPGDYDMGFRSGRSYSGATVDDCNAFDAWMVAHKTEWPEGEPL